MSLGADEIRAHVPPNRFHRARGELLVALAAFREGELADVRPLGGVLSLTQYDALGEAATRQIDEAIKSTIAERDDKRTEVERRLAG